MDTEQFYTIKEAAEKSGLTAHTLRYYERVGLLDSVSRETSGHRRYTDRDIAAIHMLTCLRRTGMPIRELQHFAAMLHSGDSDGERRLELLLAHRERVVREQEEVAKMLEVIDYKIERYSSIRAIWDNELSPEPAFEHAQT